MQAWTDYPIIEFGDVEGELAPIRRCKIVAYDGDKYAKVFIRDQSCAVTKSIKGGYLYSKPGRHGDVPNVHLKESFGEGR